MKNSKKMAEVIEKKRALSEEKTPKYGTRKLSIGLVSCMLGFSLIIAPGSSKAAEGTETPKTVSEENIQERPAVDETKPAEAPAEEVKPVESEEKAQAAETTEKETVANTKAEEVAEVKEEFKLTDAQIQRLKAANFTDAEISVVEENIKAYVKENKDFDVDAHIADVIKTKEANEKREAEESKKAKAQNRAADDAAVSEEFVEEKAKENWDKTPQDKSRWAIGENQRLVRVSTSDPIEMNDVDYDGTFVDANGRTVIRLIYKEKGAAVTAVWKRALFNFGELDQFVDYDSSYVVGVAVGKEKSDRANLIPFNDRKERMFDLGESRGDSTNQRKNLPINLVLKEGVTLKDLEGKNYTVQMRLTDSKGKRIYAYAPGKSSMDYSTYTKTTSISLDDKVNSLFLKGGYQKDSENATNQESFMSEFIANPKQYSDSKQIGIIRTQYFGQRSGNDKSPTVGGEPIAFTQAFDANLVNYLKEDDAGNIAYVNVLNNTRELSKYTHNFGIKRKDLNYSPDGKLAYFVIAPNAFQKDKVNKVEVEKHDQFTMLSGFYFTSIDYLVDKSKFENTFDESKTRKLDYSMISGWTNPNKDGWAVFEKSYDNGFVAQEGDSYLVDTTSVPTGGQIMIKIGDGDQAIIRKGQGYYNYYVTGKGSIENITEYAKGVFEFKLREGATIRPGDKLKIYMPYTKEHKDPVNFLEINNATKRNQGAATLTLNNDRNITMHIYKEGRKGHYVLKYTLADGTESSTEFKLNGIRTEWVTKDTDKVLTGIPNRLANASAGNFYINTKKLKPGADIIVESYDENGQIIEGQTSSFRYAQLEKGENYTNMTWVDHTDTSSILSVNKSLYKPYQVIFTNDYAEGTDDFYKDPKVLPSDNTAFMKDTDKIQGYTKYDGGSIRMRTELLNDIALLGKTHALADEYTDKGEIKVDNSSKLTLKGADGEKEYRVYRYDIDLNKLGEISKAGTSARDVSAEGNNKLVLKKDMKLYFNASDGSSLPTELVESRVRTRVLFDTTDGKFADASTKSVRIAPDNVKYLEDAGYTANGFTGANVAEGTGDKFAENPTAEGKTFLGWVTEAGKTALGKTITTAEAFNKLSADQKFTETTPITTHQVVYAIWSEEKLVTFDANGGKFDDDTASKAQKTNEDKTVTEPKAPTQEGKEFLGWASTKDATAPEDGILQNVEDNKTVYAVWKDAETEKTAEKVQPAYTEADAEAGKATTITAPNFTDKDGKETTKPEGAKFALGEGAPAGATINPDTGEITYTPAADKSGQEVDIPVVVTYTDGSTDNINAKVKVAAAQDVKLNNPTVTEVADPSNLTDEEKGKVEDAVKKANPNLPTDAKVTVGNDGTVTVTDKDGKELGKLTPDKTVKKTGESTSVDKKALEAEAAKKDTTKASDKYKNADQDKKDAYDKALADAEKVLKDPNASQDDVNKAKQALADAEKALNGESTSVDKKALEAEAAKKDTTKASDKYKNADQDKKDAYDKALADAEKVLKDPNASQDDVNKAKQALEEAEKALNGEAVDKAPLQSEVDKNKADAIKGSDKYKNADQDKKDAYDKALADAKKVLEDPNASQDDVNKAKKALEEAEKALNGKASKDADKISPNLPGNTKVGNKDKLTDEEKSKIADKIKEANKDKFPVGTNISVDDKGNVTITYPDGSKDIIPAEKLVSEKSKASTPAENTNAENNPAVNPGKIVVDDKNNLTNKEKSEIADKVKKINPKASKIEVANDGSVTITYPDGSTNKIAGKDLVIEKAKGQGTRKAQVNANNAPSQAKSVNKSTNVQTGIESQAGIIATLLASVGGLFASKKRKNK